MSDETKAERGAGFGPGKTILESLANAETWKYFGAETVCQGPGERYRRYSRLGEEIWAPVADILAHGGIPALPEADFDAIFTTEDCRAYAYFNMRANAPESFHEKVQRAAQRLAELRGN